MPVVGVGTGCDADAAALVALGVDAATVAAEMLAADEESAEDVADTLCAAVAALVAVADPAALVERVADALPATVGVAAPPQAASMPTPTAVMPAAAARNRRRPISCPDW
jgi:hypothetical protein